MHTTEIYQKNKIISQREMFDPEEAADIQATNI